MLQEGVPRRVLCWRLEGLELLLLFSRASVPHLPSIYCVPLSQAAPPLSPWGPEGTPSPCLISHAESPGFGGPCSVCQQACLPSSRAPGSDTTSVLSLQRAERRANKKPLALLLDRGSRRLSPLSSSSSPRLPPSAPPSRRDGCFSGPGAPSWHAVKETAGQMQGWALRVGLLWNGSFWLALVLALVHADVVRPCISCKESLFVEKEI